MDSFNEARFHGSVDAALRRIRTILDNTRNPQLPADVAHRYEDKYLLAEFLTRTATAAILQCLGGVGLTSEAVASLSEWARTRSVTLRLRAQETCTFLREETRRVEAPQQQVTEWRNPAGAVSSRTDKIVTTVQEFFWAFEFRYELVAFQGNVADQGVTLHARSGRVEIKTAAKAPPRPESVVRPSIDANVTWLFAHLDAQSRVWFSIDRTERGCHTPRRNAQIESALAALDELAAWCARVYGYFARDLFTAQPDHGRDLSAINARDVFVPVVPLFEDPAYSGAQRADARDVLPASFANAFLAEQRRSLAERCAELAQVFPRDASVISVVEATLLVTLLHANDVCQRYADGVNYIEDMLRKQLVAAIGEEVTPADFSAYMDFHSRKLFKPEFRPRPFSHAVRRPEHSPEGVVSIEADAGAELPTPISTAVSWSEARRPMSFALDASTRVSFLGDRYLHAWVSHQFSGRSELSLSLVARARQFSSFILLVGRIASADTFEPRFGIIVQNKDLLSIPLMLEQIPTPKEFRDAIESLSPEQQRFAKAFRAMQLESTLFGVCVIQIKPQLERLLKLAPDSLTKEIKLTQELLSLFIEYQIPSDLLSYDGASDAAPQDKLARVKDHVAKMREMIDLSKKRELDEAREREAMRLAEMNRTPPVVPSPYGPPPYAPQPMPMASFGAIPPPSLGGPPGMSGGGPPLPRPAMAPAMAPATSAPATHAAPPPAAPPVPQAAPRPAASTASASTANVASPRPDRPAGEGRAPDATPPAGEGVDYTRIPVELDQKFEAIDEDGALRPTIINPGDVWSKTSQKGLLSGSTEATLTDDDQRDERDKAFDLLDALSRSGALTVEEASLHVVIAATHCFDRTLVDTVICDNVNPIEKVERSLMIVATTIHGRPAAELLMDDQRERFLAATPKLIEAASPRSDAG